MAMYSPYGDRPSICRVSPFGHPRLNGYVLLNVAFRSLSRPSSAPGAKAFTLCSFFLDPVRNAFALLMSITFEIALF